MLTSGANVPDISRAPDLLDGYPPIAGRPRPGTGSPRCWATRLTAACRERGTEPIGSKPQTAGTKGLGKLRYVVEQAFALLHQFRRLTVRRECRLDIHDDHVSLACVLIYWRRLVRWTNVSYDAV